MNKILCILLNKLLYFGSAAGACKGIGIFAVREKNNFHIHSLLQYHIYSTERSFYSGRIAIVKYGNIRCVTFYKPDLVNG